jgi:hypothetical protein
MTPKPNHPWRTVKHPVAFKRWQAEQRRKRFAPEPEDKVVWESGQMVNASELQRQIIEKEMDRQQFRSTQGFRSVQNSP